MANKRINELALRTPQTTDLMLIGDPTTGYSYKTTLLSALNLGVPTTRTITINGTTFDLSANRSWSVGTVTSVGLTMPSAFNVASSPVTGSGTIAVTAAGLASQYIRGDGTLADFPGGGGSGGASVSYYLNGSVNQGTIGGVTYYEMNKTPILGAGTNFTTSSNGYIASFLTDAGDPALLKIPGGNWNTEFYFAASSGGGTPTYYLELYKYDGTTFTLIASNSSNPDAITGGTSVEQYFTTLAVPETILTATDRLAIRIYVTTAGRTITLHTENSNLCQIITTFTTGLTALNGLTAQVQYFATGSAGTDFNISSSTATHTFNIPTASATNRGLLSTADWTTFNNKVSSIIAGNAITVSNASGNVTVNHADTSGADPGATISGSNVFRSIVLDTYGHVTGLSYSSFLISDLGGTAISSPSNGQVLSYNGTNWVNSSLSGLSIITGSGTTNWVPKFTSSSAIGLSNIYDGGSFIGVFTATDNLSGAKLQVNGAATFSSSITANANAGGTSLILNGRNNAGIDDNIISFFKNDGTTLQGRIYARSNIIGIRDANNTDVLNIVGGNVGIGTTSPLQTGANRIVATINGTTSAILNLATGGTLRSYLYADSSGGTYETAGTNSIVASGSNIITFTTNSAERMRITSGGNVGIGTTAPAAPLQVAATGVGGYGTIGIRGTSAHVGFRTAADAFKGWVGYFDSATHGSDINLNIVTGYNVSSNIVFKTNGDTGEAMRITSSGNVGIGTASPAQLLDVRSANTSGATGATIRIGSQNNGNSGDEFANLEFYWGDPDAAEVKAKIYTKNVGNVGPGGGGAADLLFATTPAFGSSTERLRITSSGRTLIGTTTDNTIDLLQVAGSVLGRQLIIDGANNSNTAKLNWTRTDQSWGINNETNLRFYTGSGNTTSPATQVLEISTGGAIKTSAPSGGTAQPWKLGNVAAVSPTSPNRTIEVEVNGTTYYIHAKTTNN